MDKVAEGLADAASRPSAFNFPYMEKRLEAGPTSRRSRTPTIRAAVEEAARLAPA